MRCQEIAVNCNQSGPSPSASYAIWPTAFTRPPAARYGWSRDLTRSMRRAGQDPGILVEIDLLRPMRGSVGKFPVSVRRRGGHDEECDQGKRCPMRGYPQDESLPARQSDLGVSPRSIQASICGYRRRCITSTLRAAAAGGGFALGLDIPLGESRAPRAQAATPEINAWVVIKPDDTVVIRVARSEMGQGTITGLAQLVAEELECYWSKVTIEYPTPGESVKRNRVWGDYSTGGSRGIRESHEYVRKGGAAARMMLIQAAANEWKVPASECTAADSTITHTPSGRKTTFGKVAEAAGKLEQPKDVKLKDPKDWKIVGKALKRLDTADKVTGTMTYGIDLKRPGMLNAAIKGCPVFGGKLKSFDAAKVASMKGVKKVVQVGETAVAVVADHWWEAKTALDALPIVWDEGSNTKVSSASIAAWLKEGLDAPEAFVGNSNGDAMAALASAAKTVEAVYSYPYQAHAALEPMNATAIYNAD